MPFAALLTTTRTGFCDGAFASSCPVASCGGPINRETLGISRLLEDCLEECSAPRERVPASELWEGDWEQRRRNEEAKVGRKLIACVVLTPRDDRLPSRR